MAELLPGLVIAVPTVVLGAALALTALARILDSLEGSSDGDA